MGYGAWSQQFDIYLLKQVKLCNGCCRQRNGINARSNVEVLLADHDLYVSKVDERLLVKLGPRFDMGWLAPKDEDGWKMCASGPNYAVWER